MTERRSTHRLAGIAAALVALSLTTLGLADQVRLSSGEVLTGNVVEQTAEKVVIEHPVLGRLEIPSDSVTSVVLDDDVAGDDETTSTDDEAAEESAGDAGAADDAIEAAKEEKLWKFTASLAGTGSWGNTDEQSVRVGFTADKVTDAVRIDLDAQYYGGLTDGDTTDNSFSTSGTHDWLIPDSRWFYFAAGTYNFDQFESWDHRVFGQVGPGYELIKKDDFWLNLRGGIGPRKEWGSDDDSIRFEAGFGPRFGWQISERQKLSGRSHYFFVVDDHENYRIISRLDWSLMLDPELNMSLIAGLRHEYQDEVDPGDDRNNTDAFIGIQVEF
jgi:hypothetical protein